MKSDKGSFGRKGLFKSVNRCIDLKDLFTLHWILFSFFLCVFLSVFFLLLLFFLLILLSRCKPVISTSKCNLKSYLIFMNTWLLGGL